MGGRVLHVIIPSSWQVDPTEWQDIRAFAKHPTLFQLGFERQWIAERLVAFAKQRNMAILNLVPHYKATVSEGKGPLYNKVDGHFNSKGYNLAARVIWRELTRE